MDDTILWSANIEEALFQAVKWLDICGNNGITLNPEKYVFAADSIEFAGIEISPTSVRPGPSLRGPTIEKFPTARNITDIRSWHDLVN